MPRQARDKPYATTKVDVTDRFVSLSKFSNGPLAIAALGNKLGGHNLGGVTFSDVVVKDDGDRPVLVVVGSEGDGADNNTPLPRHL